MGLKFPQDLNDWKKWEQKQNLPRYFKSKLKRGKEPESQSFIWSKRPGSAQPQILIALEATTPTQLAALVKPGFELEKLGFSIALVTLPEYSGFLEEHGFTSPATFTKGHSIPVEFNSVDQVIAVGNYLPVGEWAHNEAQIHGWDFNVIQHGLNSPFVPPLPTNSHLFSFSDKDSEFWISGRQDITADAVGSQLFYEAFGKGHQLAQKDNDLPVIFLGQMHGAELPRLSFAKSSYKFCKDNNAKYRPHPSEKDKISVLTHKLWEKQGILIDSGGLPLNQCDNPVVSIFSTGVLEAAIRGVPSWVYHSNPPAWLEEFWDRYGMSRWGSAPTPAPVQPEIEPALAIANIIAHRLEK